MLGYIDSSPRDRGYGVRIHFTSSAHMASGMLRVATASDIPGIQRVRHSVHENRLVSTVILDSEMQDAIEHKGRGWVVEVNGDVVAFAIGNAQTGNLWAFLFIPSTNERNRGNHPRRAAREV